MEWKDFKALRDVLMRVTLDWGRHFCYHLNRPHRRLITPSLVLLAATRFYCAKSPPGHYVTQSSLGAECYRKEVKSKAVPGTESQSVTAWHRDPAFLPGHPLQPPVSLQTPTWVSVPTCSLLFPPHDFICATCFPGLLVAGCLTVQSNLSRPPQALQ